MNALSYDFAINRHVITGIKPKMLETEVDFIQTDNCGMAKGAKIHQVERRAICNKNGCITLMPVIKCF
jgi:hypothetical protein